MKKEDGEIFIVVTGEDSPDSGTGGFVHLVTRSRTKAVRKLRKVVNSLGFDYLKRGTNDGDKHADERYDSNGMYACVNTFGNGVSFEAEVKCMKESEFEKETCI